MLDKSLIDKISAIAIHAGDIILDIRKRGFNSKTKSNEFDFVTDADIAAEKYILERLEKEFPQDSILSEERGFIGKKSSRVWFVDPLDGTKDFKHGGLGFSVIIGLCIDNKPELGVIYEPVTKRLYFGQKGQGAYLRAAGKDTQLFVSGQDSIHDSTMIVRIPHGEKREADKFELAFKVKKILALSSIGLKLSLVASGEADFSVITNSHTSKWDTCAPQVILEEAGGMITDFFGQPLDYSQKENSWSRLYIVSNGKLHKDALAVLVLGN